MKTETITKTEIKEAMKVLRLDNWTEELLNEIELDRELEISIAQADRGELIPIEEVKKEIEELFNNGHFNEK